MATPFETPLCPVGCGRVLPGAAKVMCKPCWAKVPVGLKNEVYTTWRERQHALTKENVRRHREAKAAAIASVRGGP